MSVQKGRLVAVEGADGTGKNTQTQLLVDRLRNVLGEQPVIHLSFPTYGRDPVADLIRTMLTHHREEWNQRPWQSKAVLYASNRVREFAAIANTFAQGAVVVCDRYVPSNQAHMAAYQEDPSQWQRVFEWIDRFEYDEMDLPRPDIVFLLTMSAQQRSALLSARANARRVMDAHEADALYLDRVTLCFQQLAEENPESWRVIPANVDETLQSPEQIHNRLWTELEQHAAWKSFLQ